MSASSSTTRMRARFIPFSYRKRPAIATCGRHDTTVARVLIIEPHDEVRDLLARVVRRLGHGVIFPAPAPGLVDAVIVEPAAAADLALARRAQVASGAAVVCVSIYPTGDEALAL